MSHARYRRLDDIGDVLAKIRAWPQIVERAPGIFYIRRTPFMHFHTRDAARWADAKTGATWGSQIPLPFGASGKLKSTFLNAVRTRYEACVKAWAASSPAPIRPRPSAGPSASPAMVRRSAPTRQRGETR